MQYIYDKLVSPTTTIIKIEEQNYKYLFKVRRVSIDEVIKFRNLVDNNLYYYQIEQIERRFAIARLKSFEELEVKPSKYIHLGWCMIDPKVIEKSLPSLNELGVSKISFIYCKYSQNNFRLNLDRINSILISSNIQTGRTDMIQIEIVDDLASFRNLYPNSAILHFSKDRLANGSFDFPIVVGCEGGFGEDEIKLYENSAVGLNTNLILRSETAISSIASLLMFS